MRPRDPKQYGDEGTKSKYTIDTDHLGSVILGKLSPHSVENFLRINTEMPTSEENKNRAF